MPRLRRRCRGNITRPSPLSFPFTAKSGPRKSLPLCDVSRQSDRPFFSSARASGSHLRGALPQSLAGTDDDSSRYKAERNEERCKEEELDRRREAFCGNPILVAALLRRARSGRPLSIAGLARDDKGSPGAALNALWHRRGRDFGLLVNCATLPLCAVSQCWTRAC